MKGRLIMVELFKDGDNMGIVTDARTEYEFISQISEAFDSLITQDRFEGDWEFQFSFWLPQIADICCAYRNYKNSVVVRRQFISGEFYPVKEHSIIVTGEIVEVKKMQVDKSHAQDMV